MFVFLDESGNTGTNWLDINQPYFVYAGWIINDSKVTMAEQVFTEVFPNARSEEIKAKHILRNNPDQFYEFMNRFLDVEVDAIPVFVAVDKNYMVAAKMVETFFDSEHNRNLNSSILFNIHLKQAIADCISSETSILQKFSELIEHGSIPLENMQNIRDELSRFFVAHSLTQVANSIGSLDDKSLEQMIDEFDQERPARSLTGTILFELLERINGVASNMGDTINVVVDELTGYDEEFSLIETFSTNLSLDAKRITQAQSENTLLLQAAELLVGYVYRCLCYKESYINDTKSVNLWKELIECYSYYLNDMDFSIFDYDFPYTSLNFLFELSGNPQRCDFEQPREVIKRLFPNCLKG